jgi:hypothetical protein
MDRVLEEIVSACLIDGRIREIVENITLMSKEKREEFKRKMNIYFAGRASDNDVQAYRFYKIVLENAEEILEEVRKREGVKR